jgi:hypothetical protein
MYDLQDLQLLDQDENPYRQALHHDIAASMPGN